MAKTPTKMELHCLSPIEWVKEERRRQVEKRGEQNHNPFRWMGTLAEEFGEAAKALNDIVESKPEANLEELEYELIQTAAVAVAFIEAIRRAKGTQNVETPINSDAIQLADGGGVMLTGRRANNA